MYHANVVCNVTDRRSCFISIVDISIIAFSKDIKVTEVKEKLHPAALHIGISLNYKIVTTKRIIIMIKG